MHAHNLLACPPLAAQEREALRDEVVEYSRDPMRFLPKIDEVRAEQRELDKQLPAEVVIGMFRVSLVGLKAQLLAKCDACARLLMELVGKRATSLSASIWTKRQPSPNAGSVPSAVSPSPKSSRLPRSPTNSASGKISAPAPSAGSPARRACCSFQPAPCRGG